MDFRTVAAPDGTLALLGRDRGRLEAVAVARIAVNLGLYLAGMIGQLGQLPREEPPGGETH